MSSSAARILAICLWLAGLAWRAEAVTLGSNAITSTNGIHLDSDQDGAYEVVIGGNGSLEAGAQAGGVYLGVTGNARILSSLDLSGNAVLSGNAGLCAGNVLVDAANAMLRIGSLAPKSALHLSGSLGLVVQQVTGNTTLGENTLVLAKPDQAGGNIVLTLPAAATVTGRTYHIKKSSNSANTVTIDGTIDGSANLVLAKDTIGYPYAEVASDGAAWYVAYRSDSTNALPRLSRITEKSTPRNVPLRYVTFTADEGWRSEESLQILSVQACTSSNQALVANGNITSTFTDEGRGGYGELTITPSTNQVGTTDIHLTVTDGLEAVSGNFLLTVTGATSPPTAYPVHACTNINTAVDITLFAVDLTAGHNIQTWTQVTQPRHGTLSAGTNVLTYTPDTGFTGRDWFTYYATDSAGEASSLAMAGFLVTGNAALVVGTLSPLGEGETTLKGILESMGVSVGLHLDNTNNTGSEADGVDLLIISSTCNPTKIKSEYINKATPIMNCLATNYGGTNGMDLCSAAGSTTSSNTLTIVANHPMAGGLASGNHWVYNPATHQSHGGTPYASATTVGIVNNDPANPGMFVYASGANINGLLAPAKRVASFMNGDATGGRITPTGNILVKAAINEALAR